MPRYFTYYWSNESVKRRAQAAGSDKIDYVASDRFIQRGVSQGDVIYPMTVIQGVLYLLGILKVGKMCDFKGAREELGHDPDWIAKDYLLADEPEKTRFDLKISAATGRKLRFVRGEVIEAPKFIAPEKLDRQAMRVIRELTPESVAILEEALGWRRS